jgi:uncharacterized protein YfdQ (DUF2303 family)
VTDTQPIIDAATRAAEPKVLNDSERFHVVVSPTGQVHLYDLFAEAEKHSTANIAPARKTGTYQVHDASSFVAYIAKHGNPDTEVWADTVNAKITGVINAHIAGGPNNAQFEDHKVAYSVQLTEAWKAWASRDGKLDSQSDFAELIEDRALDIVQPAAADMLELAQTFQATIGVSFESSKRLSSGERQLAYREQVDAKAGRAGQMDIPETFVLGVRPFEGADPYKVTARLRYRITDGVLRIGYKLERPEDVMREAFLGVVAKVQTGISELDRLNSPIFLGSR